jgi:hypothetical protein
VVAYQNVQVVQASDWLVKRAPGFMRSAQAPLLPILPERAQDVALRELPLPTDGQPPRVGVRSRAAA